MALTRKMLQAMDISADKIDEIINAHSETVNALKEERDRYKADADKLAEVTKERDTAKASLAEAVKEDWKSKYEKEHTDFEGYKATIASEKVKNSKTEAYKALLIKAGVSEKRVDTILKVSDLAALELDKDNKLKDESKLMESIKSEWADFIVKESKQGAGTPNPPAGGEGSAFEKLSLAEKMNYANSHPDDREVQAWLKK